MLGSPTRSIPVSSLISRFRFSISGVRAMTSSSHDIPSPFYVGIFFERSAKKQIFPFFVFEQHFHADLKFHQLIVTKAWRKSKFCERQEIRYARCRKRRWRLEEEKDRPEEKDIDYAGIFFLAPAGTVIVPCLVTRDLYLWFARLYKVQQRPKSANTLRLNSGGFYYL